MKSEVDIDPGFGEERERERRKQIYNLDPEVCRCSNKPPAINGIIRLGVYCLSLLLLLILLLLLLLLLLCVGGVGRGARGVRERERGGGNAHLCVCVCVCGRPDCRTDPSFQTYGLQDLG